jgi:hypothetical protein
MTASSEVSTQRITHLKNYQLETIAKLICLSASSPEQIAETVGVPPKRIMGLLSGRNKTFNKLRDKYAKLVAEEFHGATMRMVEMLPKAHEAMENALESDDKRLAVETAFKIHDAVGLGAKRQSGGETSQPGVNVHIHSNPEATTILTSGITEVGSMLSELRTHLQNDSGQSHELSGSAALPVPAGQLQVTNDEALPTEEDALGVFHVKPLPDED